MSGMSAMEEEKLSSRAVASIVGQQSEAIQQMASEYATKVFDIKEEVSKFESLSLESGIG